MTTIQFSSFAAQSLVVEANKTFFVRFFEQIVGSDLRIE